MTPDEFNMLPILRQQQEYARLLAAYAKLKRTVEHMEKIIDENCRAIDELRSVY
jgi:hypothetical protein